MLQKEVSLVFSWFKFRSRRLRRSTISL